MPSEKSTIHGHVHSFKGLLDTFLSELGALKEFGLPEPAGANERECIKVRSVLNDVTEHVLEHDEFSLLRRYGSPLAQLSSAYIQWNQAPRGEDGVQMREKCLDLMYEARRGMPKQDSWGPDRPLVSGELTYLKGLRAHFVRLCDVAGPETIKLQKHRKAKKNPVPAEKPIERLPDGQPKAFPRTCRQASR